MRWISSTDIFLSDARSTSARQSCATSRVIRRPISEAKANNLVNAPSKTRTLVEIRRARNSSIAGIHGLLEGLDWTKIWLMPNTAGSQTTEEAVRLAFMGREILKNLNYTDNNFVKLEVIPDPKHLLPDSLGTLTAAEYLVNNNFDVLPYVNADPILAKQLESVGCVTVMPLGSPIGSGQGLKNLYNIKIIII